MPFECNLSKYDFNNCKITSKIKRPFIAKIKRTLLQGGFGHY